MPIYIVFLFLLVLRAVWFFKLYIGIPIYLHYEHVFTFILVYHSKMRSGQDFLCISTV